MPEIEDIWSDDEDNEMMLNGMNPYVRWVILQRRRAMQEDREVDEALSALRAARKEG